jgi:hypothetical protein
MAPLEHRLDLRWRLVKLLQGFGWPVLILQDKRENQFPQAAHARGGVVLGPTLLWLVNFFMMDVCEAAPIRPA